MFIITRFIKYQICNSRVGENITSQLLLWFVNVFSFSWSQSDHITNKWLPLIHYFFNKFRLSKNLYTSDLHSCEATKQIKIYTIKLTSILSFGVSTVETKLEGFVYETFQIETDQVILEKKNSESNPRTKSLRIGLANLNWSWSRSRFLKTLKLSWLRLSMKTIWKIET